MRKTDRNYRAQVIMPESMWTWLLKQKIRTGISASQQIVQAVNAMRSIREEEKAA